ncbi:MAG: TMEM165/GDT1 family protein [Nannocystis sp.]|nr:TMEM165/GDT1 family protein [Nannocystis sp.]MBA3545232.1 TMEM165/GDT1 family protein [Nannocystis sp.]
MDLRSFLTTFGLVFLAELGDKTQLATMSMAATGGQKWLVFAAAALALVLSSLIAVLVGDLLRSRIDPVLVQRAAAVLFLVLGGWMLFDTFRARPPEATPAPLAGSPAER